MSATHVCPKCGSTDLEELMEDVDNGVGIQYFLVGYRCVACDEGITICYTCGAFPDGEHEAWCPSRTPAEVAK